MPLSRLKEHACVTPARSLAARAARVSIPPSFSLLGVREREILGFPRGHGPQPEEEEKLNFLFSGQGPPLHGLHRGFMEAYFVF